MMAANMRNGQEQDHNIDWRFQPFHRKKYILVGKHPIGHGFISRPDAAATNDAPKYILPRLVSKEESGIVGLEPFSVELVLGSLRFLNIESKMNGAHH